MYIASKENGIILNFGNVVELFTGSNGTAIAAKQADGKVIIMQEYETKKEAKEAIIAISEEMGRKNIIYIPNREELKGRIINGKPYKNPHHYENGKKTKGYGGS